MVWQKIGAFRWIQRFAPLFAFAACSSLLPAQAPPPGDNIRVVLLGTASGPPAHVSRAGISTLVEAGGDRFLFDAGRGFMQRMVQYGLPMSAVTKLFITHLHSDHVVDVVDLYLTPWSSPSARQVPLEVWGPAGTRSMMQHLEQAFAFDIHVRRDIDERASPEGIRFVAEDIREGKVYDKNGVTITAFLVDHGAVKPAFGFRLDYKGHSVAISGDTRPSDNLVKHCTGVDLLIHEAIDPEALKKLNPSPILFQAIVRHHTTPEQAGEVFRKAKPKLAVFSHSPGTPAIVAGAKKVYEGRVEMGEDLMVIDIGDEVRVTRPKR